MDVLFVLDISGSMSGNKIDKVKSDATELTESIMANNQNKVGVIVYSGKNAPNGPSRIIQGLTTDKATILADIDALTAYGMTNYNSGYKNILQALNGYQKQNNRELVVLFLTDGYPNEDTPNQIGTYQEIKDKYPYITINGIQYEMGSTIKQQIVEVTDNQFIADMETLNNVLFEAAEYEKIYIETYDKFIIEDYIDSKFKVNSVDDIKVSIGTVTLTNENGLQKITWDLGDTFKTGSTANMTIKADLKEQYHNTNGLYPTNDHETIKTKLPEEQEKTENSPKTPTLPKEKYQVIYDSNNPTGCNAQGFNEEYYPFDKVIISSISPTCNGWNFKGWEIVDNTGIGDITDNSFTMPEKNVTLRAKWGKPSISKSMDGTVFVNNKKTAEFEYGIDVNEKMKKLANNTTSTVSLDIKIKSIKRLDNLPNNFVPTTANTVSSSTSELPIYIYFDSSTGTMYYYTEASDVYLNEYSTDMFSEMASLEDISGLSELNTSRVIVIGWETIEEDDGSWVGSDGGWGMFSGCSSLSDISPLANWDVSNVVHMGDLFSGCTSLTNIEALRNWDVSNVKYMEEMFGGCNNLLDVSPLANWDVSKVKHMDGMFAGCKNLTDISSINNWDTSSVVGIESMFYGCEKAQGTITLKGTPVHYGDMFKNAATTGDGITVNYSRSITNIDNIIATKSSNSKVYKGVQID